MKISLEALQVLDAIESRGSFAAAAQDLHRVPSALTHAINKLEEQLGFDLFERDGRRAVLTPAGRTLLEDGRNLLRAAGELECRARRVATGWESELRIAVSALIDTPRLYPLLAEFYTQMSGTRIRLLTEVLAGCWDALVTDRADLVLGAEGEAPPGGGYVMKPLGQSDFVFAVAPHHPLAAEPEPLSAATIQQHRAVALADTARQLIARTAGLLSGQDVLTVASFADKLAAQVAGLGVGHLPRHIAEREVQSGRLVVRQVAEAAPQIPHYVAWRSGHQGKALRWFAERLEDEALRRQLLGLPPRVEPERALAGVRSRRS